MASQQKVAASMRTVLLKVSPAPANLSERRAVLRALKQHGEIDVFKNLHDPSAFISVTTNFSTAQGLIARSPLQFDFAGGRPAATPAGSPAAPKTPNKTFTIGIWEKPDYGHNTRIRESQLYGKWPDQDHLFQQTSFATAALRRAVPPSMAWTGLVDWDKAAEGGTQAAVASFLSTKEDYIAARRIRQANRKEFDSLMDKYRDRNEGGEGYGENESQRGFRSRR